MRHDPMKTTTSYIQSPTDERDLQMEGATMTTEEINKYIHEQIQDVVEPQCNHYWDESYPDHLQHCEYCGFELPDYCSDSSPRSLLNRVVAKVLVAVGRDVYDDAMEDVLRAIIEPKYPPIRSQRDANEVAEDVVTASINPTALQIATAAMNAHKAFLTSQANHQSTIQK